LPCHYADATLIDAMPLLILPLLIAISLLRHYYAFLSLRQIFFDCFAIADICQILFRHSLLIFRYFAAAFAIAIFISRHYY